MAHYARREVELGAPKAELSEMLAIAAAMGGCVGETWALKAFAAAKQAPADGRDDAACCSHA